MVKVKIKQLLEERKYFFNHYVRQYKEDY